MADTLCGPSNPLQSLQKQTSADRTLQQDRLAFRQTPVQGFRSAGPHAGALDTEFESFQAGQVHFPNQEHYGFNQSAFVPNQELQHVGQLHGSANWAGDFARINLSGPSSAMIHPLAAPHAQYSAQNGQNRAWQREFTSPVAQPPDQGSIQYDTRLRGQGMVSGWAPQYSSGASAMNFQNQQSQNYQAQVAEEVFDEEAFARAFDEAESWQRPAADWELELDQAVRDSERAKQEKELEEFVLGQDISTHQTNENILENPFDPNQETKRLGADLIINPITDLPLEQRPIRNPNQDNDALARTAGHLLDSVSNNTDPKFQNSQFLRLMQQFRDREVAVKGDKIVSNDMDMDGNDIFDRKGKQVAAEIGVVSS